MRLLFFKYIIPSFIRQIHNTKFYSSSTLYQVLFVKYIVPRFILQILYTKFYSSNTLYQVLFVKYIIPSFIRQIYCTKFYQSNTLYQVFYSNVWNFVVNFLIFYSKCRNRVTELLLVCWTYFFHGSLSTARRYQPQDIFPIF